MANTHVNVFNLKGNPKNPEKAYHRIAFPGGDVEVARTSDNEYWVHIHVNHEFTGNYPDGLHARISDARLDIHGRHASDVDPGEFSDPNLYHVALKVTRTKEDGQ